MKKLWLTILMCLVCSAGWGATTQSLVSGSNTTLSASATEYSVFYGQSTQANFNFGGSGGETEASTVFPAAGTVSDLRMVLSTDPDNGASVQSYTFTVRLDGAGTALSCAISDGSTTCQDSDSFSVTAGQLLSMEVVPANTPATGDAYWSAIWTPTTADNSILSGCGTDITTGAVAYLSPAGCKFDDADEHDTAIMIPTGGTFKNLYVEISTAAGSGKSWTFKLRNTGDTASIDCAISGVSATTCNSTLESETASASAGDKFVLEVTPSGTPSAVTTVKYGVVFVPTTSGEFIVPAVTENNFSATDTHYWQPLGGKVGSSTTESDMRLTSSAMTIKNMYAWLENDPGTAPNEYAFTLMKNGSAASATFTCAVTAANYPTCNDTENITISNDDLLTTRIVPTSSPTTGSGAISYTGFIAPTGGTRRVFTVQ
jgi:hypothetical protein